MPKGYIVNRVTGQLEALPSGGGGADTEQLEELVATAQTAASNAQTSANNAQNAAIEVQNSLSNYLPLSGGNMTGRIGMGRCDGFFDNPDGGQMALNANVGGVRGATLALFDSVVGDGAFACGARNASVAKYLFGHTDGRLTWDSSEVLRANMVSVGGIGDGTTGTLKLPSGGTWKGFWLKRQSGTVHSMATFTSAGGTTLTTITSTENWSAMYVAIRVA